MNGMIWTHDMLSVVRNSGIGHGHPHRNTHDTFDLIDDRTPLLLEFLS